MDGGISKRNHMFSKLKSVVELHSLDFLFFLFFARYVVCRDL